MIPLFTPRVSEDIQRVARKRVNAFFKRFKETKGKTEMIMSCDPTALLLCFRDIHHATLSVWDRKKRCRYRPSFRDDDFVDFDENITIQGRHNVVWWRYDMRKRTYTVIHCTMDEADETFEGFWFQLLRSGNCFVQTNRGIDVLQHVQDVVRSRESIERVFENWTCGYCSLAVPSAFLACSKCKRPRYWICENPECEWSQAEDAQVCRNCGTIKGIA